jgi:hypothetical protein
MKKEDRDLLTAIARRNETARTALRQVNNVRKFLRQARKLGGQIERLGR